MQGRSQAETGNGFFFSGGQLVAPLRLATTRGDPTRDPANCSAARREHRLPAMNVYGASAGEQRGDDPIEVAVRNHSPDDPTLLFHCLVPAAHWWDDIAFT